MTIADGWLLGTVGLQHDSVIIINIARIARIKVFEASDENKGKKVGRKFKQVGKWNFKLGWNK